MYAGRFFNSAIGHLRQFPAMAGGNGAALSLPQIFPRRMPRLRTATKHDGIVKGRMDAELDLLPGPGAHYPVGGICAYPFAKEVQIWPFGNKVWPGDRCDSHCRELYLQDHQS